jgi:hypothetical protein
MVEGTFHESERKTGEGSPLEPGHPFCTDRSKTPMRQTPWGVGWVAAHQINRDGRGRRERVAALDHPA